MTGLNPCQFIPEADIQTQIQGPHHSINQQALQTDLRHNAVQLQFSLLCMTAFTVPTEVKRTQQPRKVGGCASYRIACLFMTADLKAFCSCIQVSCSNRGPPCSRATWAAHSCSTLTSIAWLCSVRDCTHTSNHFVVIRLFTCSSCSHGTDRTAATLAQAFKRLISHTQDMLSFMHEHSCATVGSESAIEVRHKPQGCCSISHLHEELNIRALSSAQCD